MKFIINTYPVLTFVDKLKFIIFVSYDLRIIVKISSVEY